MAMAPIEQRLESILPEAQPEPQVMQYNSTELTETILETSDLMPTDDSMLDPTQGEPVQVAGIGSLKQLFIKGAKDVAQDAVPPGPPAPPQQVIEAQKGKQVLEKMEQTIEAAPATGKPPEQLINVEQIEGPDDFKQMVNSLGSASGIQVQRQSFEQTLDIVKKKYGNGPAMDLAALKKQYGDMPADVLNLRIASYQNHLEFYDLARQSYLQPDNQDLMAALLVKLNRQTAINEAYVGVRTRAAQATAIGGMKLSEPMAREFTESMRGIKIPASSSAEVRKMLTDPNVSDNLKVLVEKMNELTDEAAKAQLIDKVSRVGLAKDLWDLVWKNGLLSASGTHIVNLGSSVTFLASSVATRQLAGFISAGKRGVGMQGTVEMGEAAAQMAGIINSQREGLQLAWKALRTGTTREMREGMPLISDAGQKFEGNYQIFDARQYGIENELTVKGINALANFATLLGGRPIMAMDEYFKFIGYRAEVNAQAYRASIQAKRSALEAGKSAEEAEEISLQVLGQNLANPSPEVDAVAKDHSHMLTFSRKLTGSAAQVQQFAQENVVGRIMLPFVKTPVWVTSESMQHSPFAFASKQWRADIAKGGADRELAMAKMGMGSMIMVGAGSYVADGRITGGGPGNQALKQTYMASGWRPYSFVFQDGEWDAEFVDYLKTVNIDPSIGKDGKLYVPFRGIDPIAGPLAMVADAVEYARYEDDQDLVGQVVLGATWGLYSYVGSQPFVTAISGIAGAFSQNIPNPKESFKNAINAIVEQGTSYAIEGSPVGIFNSARGMVARAVDPMKRDVSSDPNDPVGVAGFYSALDRFKSRTPGLSEDLPESYDYLGEPEFRGDPANPWLSSMSGIRYQTTNQRAVDKIIIQLGVPVQKPGKSVMIRTDIQDSDGSDISVNVKLTPRERQDMIRSIALVTDENGDNVQDAIVRLVSTPGFEGADRLVKQEMVREKYQEFTKMAREMYLSTPSGEAVRKRAEDSARTLPIYGKRP